MLGEHTTELVEMGEKTIPIDRNILPLLRHLWAGGCRTEYSCEGGPGEKAYLVFADGFSLERALHIFDDLACRVDDIQLRQRMSEIEQGLPNTWELRLGARLEWMGHLRDHPVPSGTLDSGILNYVVEFPVFDLEALTDALNSPPS